MKLSQVRLLVEDFPPAFRFYRDVLGFEPTFGGEDDGYASFGTVAIFERREPAGTLIEIHEELPTGDA